VKATRAITRGVGRRLSDCSLTFVGREPIDVEKAISQHTGYVEALRRAGTEVDVLPADDSLPDSVFVEDAAVPFHEAAVLTLPGNPRRRPEVPAIADALRRYRRLIPIVEPATLDGGDVLSLGRRFFVGLSSRTNPEGVSQFASAVRPFGYDVAPIEVRGCLHLKTAVTALDEETLLVNRSWIDASALPAVRIVEVPPEEPFGANALAVNGVVHLSARWEHARRVVEEAGFTVTALDVSEFEKAEGGLTCLSLLLD
jgi:dimethylargininase